MLVWHGPGEPPIAATTAILLILGNTVGVGWLGVVGRRGCRIPDGDVVYTKENIKGEAWFGFRIYIYPKALRERRRHFLGPNIMKIIRA